jgi:uncharacterized sporulation protein YeaH/YhbH (DUF444 family)
MPPNLGMDMRQSMEDLIGSMEAYRRAKSSVKRFFAWLKPFRRVTISYETLAVTFPSFIRATHIHILESIVANP